MKSLFASADMGLLGLLFFFVFFCAVTIWTFRPGAKKHYQDLGELPLKEKDGQEITNE